MTQARPYAATEPAWQRVKLSRTGLVRAGMHLLAIYGTLWTYLEPQGFSISNILLAVLLLTSASMILGAIIAPPTLGPRELIPIGQVMFALLVFWWLGVIARAVEPSFDRFITFVANPQIGSLGWLAPLAILIGCRPWMMRQLWQVFYIHALWGAALSTVLFAVYLIDPGRLPPKSFTWDVATDLLYGVPVLLLIGWGAPHQRLFLAFCLTCMVLVNYLVFYRTFVMLYAGLAIFLVVVAQTTSVVVIFRRTLLLAIVCGATLFVTAPYVAKSLPQDAFVDTRSFLLEELFDDLSKGELLVGRGALGRYFSPYFEGTLLRYEEGDSPDRQLSEIGYLHLILKGGFVAVVLYLAIAVTALVRLLTRDAGRLGFMLALVIGLQLVIMAVHGDTYFSLYNLVFWMIVGVGLARARPEDAMPTSLGHSFGVRHAS